MTAQRLIYSFKGLQAALADPRINRYVLRSDINITAPVEIPAGTFVKFDRYSFVGHGFPVTFDGDFDVSRREVFRGFAPGEVRGSFSSDTVYPEWWGLGDGHTDVAINCAIKSHAPSERGCCVKLASGIYFVSAPLDLRGSLSYLEGAGSGATQIRSTSEWDGATEMTSWMGPHKAMIWIGGTAPGIQTFRTGVRKLQVHGYAASISQPLSRISLISGSGGVEENTVIEDVVCSYFTGFGIGFDNMSTMAVNGLHLRNFWIIGAMGRRAVPIYCPVHAGVMNITSGTIDCRVVADNQFSWPEIGIVARGGHTVLNGLHIEGCGTGIYVSGHDSPTAVIADSIAFNWLMDHGMVNFDDPVPDVAPLSLAAEQAAYPDNLDPGRTDYWYRSQSAGLVIGRGLAEYQSHKAYNITVEARQLRNYGRCKYLVRDGLYGVHHSPFGYGQYRNSGRGVLRRYSRGEGYINQHDGGGQPFIEQRNVLWTNQPGHFTLEV